MGSGDSQLAPLRLGGLGGVSPLPALTQQFSGGGGWADADNSASCGKEKISTGLDWILEKIMSLWEWRLGENGIESYLENWLILQRQVVPTLRSGGVFNFTRSRLLQDFLVLLLIVGLEKALSSSSLSAAAFERQWYHYFKDWVLKIDKRQVYNPFKVSLNPF